MKLTYDPRYNIAYISLRAKTEQVETVRVGEDLNVDLAPDGSIFGIELLNANEQLRGGDGGALIVIDEASGQRHEIPLG
jgi:uncharacterized protein YuzE